MEIAEGCQCDPWLESTSLTKKGERPQKGQSPSLNHFEVIGKKQFRYKIKYYNMNARRCFDQDSVQ